MLAVTTAAGRWVASADRAVWLPAGTWHQHRFYGASAFHTVGFPASRRCDPGPGGGRRRALLRELLIACADPALTAGRSGGPRRHPRPAPALPQQPITLPAPRDPRLADACAIVAETFHAAAAGRAGRRVGAGERTLSRLFRAEFGMTYPQWRTRVRVFEAMVLLAAGAAVTHTAHRCGWETTSSFIDTFRHDGPHARRLPARLV